MYDAFGSLAFMESLIVEPSTVVSSSTLVDGAVFRLCHTLWLCFAMQPMVQLSLLYFMSYSVKIFEIKTMWM